MYTRVTSPSEKSELGTSCTQAYEAKDEKRIHLAIFLSIKPANGTMNVAKQPKNSFKQYEEIVSEENFKALSSKRDLNLETGLDYDAFPPVRPAICVSR